MANPWAGEVALTIDGTRRTLKLTLGALAGLEARLKSASLIELIERFESGRFGSGDVLAVIDAGLIGGGNPPVDLMTADVAGGPVAAAKAAAALLVRAFSLPPEAADDDA